MVLKHFLFLCGFGLSLVACQNNPQPQSEFDKQTPAEQGASLYSMHCAQCHGEDGKLGASGAKDLSKSSLSEAQISKIIENGKGAMPPMKALLETDRNTILVIDHIKKLRR